MYRCHPSCHHYCCDHPSCHHHCCHHHCHHHCCHHHCYHPCCRPWGTHGAWRSPWGGRNIPRGRREASYAPPPQSCSVQGEPVLVGKGRGRGQTKGTKKAAPKKDWSLDAAVEEDVIEGLKGNNHLWMRSKKAYKQKRAAWEMKAQELGINVEHLEQWWRTGMWRSPRRPVARRPRCSQKGRPGCCSTVAFTKVSTFNYIDFKCVFHCICQFHFTFQCMKMLLQAKCQCHMAK